MTLIHKERLAKLFKDLVEIDSVSKDEKRIADAIAEMVIAMGAKVSFDDSLKNTGSNTGNIIIKFDGNLDGPPLLLSAHMDTVEPGQNIQVRLAEGVFSSVGNTILGADDKSAIAIIIEVLRVILENNLPYRPLEIVFTTCEEIGLLGAKNLDFSQLKAKYGYVLDTSDLNGIITRAPAANNFNITIHGKDAHAGACPEKGINAILLAGKAIANLELGRVDYDTTCNIGMIEGGLATNIVPEKVTIKGEVRSHVPEKLKRTTNKILASFQNVIESAQRELSTPEIPSLDFQIIKEFSNTHIPDDHFVVKTALTAAHTLGKEMAIKATGGGSDANIFFEKGILMGVLGTGMRDMHTLRESIVLNDMVQTAELLLNIIEIHTQKNV